MLEILENTHTNGFGEARMLTLVWREFYFQSRIDGREIDLNG
jgi:hypothetical protein